jgi:hypothetical protein
LSFLPPRLVQLGQRKPFIRPLNKTFVKSFLRTARLIARDEQDGLPLGIKRISDAPDTVIGIKKRNSFILACFEAFSVSDRGRFS